MRNIKYAYLFLTKRIILSVAIFIQIVIITYLTYSLLSINNKINIEADKVLKVFDNKKAWYMKVGNDFVNKYNNDEIEEDNVRGIYKEFESSNVYEHIYLGENSKYLKYEEGMDAFRKNPSKVVISNNEYIPVKAFGVSKNAYDFYEMKVKLGTGFKKEDFEIQHEELPMILGNDYIGKYNVGDIIQYAEGESIKRAKVIGFLEKDYYILYKIDIVEKYINLNNSIITPYINLDKIDSNNSEFQGQIFNLFNTSYFLFKENMGEEDIESEINKINNRMSELGFGKQNIKSAEKYLSESMVELKEQQSKSKLITGISILFLWIGIVASYNFRIKNDKKEFGVHILNGATLKDISIMVFYEVILLFISGYLGGIGMINLLMYEPLNFSILINVIIGLIVLSIFISFIPYLKINNMNINDIIRGEE